MSACLGCEQLPESLPAYGHIYFWPPLGHTSSKLCAVLEKHDIAIEQPGPQCLKVAISDTCLDALRKAVPTALGRLEIEDTKCLVMAHGAEPSLDEASRIVSLATMLGRLDGRWLWEILAERRLTTMFQPIVQIDNPSNVFAHECLVRGLEPDGTMVPPYKLYDAARNAKMLFHLDRASRLQHIRAANQHQLDTHIFINFNPTSIYDPEYCLRTTFAAIRNCNIPAERFVFEVVESDHVGDPERLPRILEFYRNAGFRVALDDLGAGFSSLNLLSRLKPDFVKFDMELIRNIDQDTYKSHIVSKLIDVARSVGVTTVVEGIETDGEWHWAIEHGAHLGQGYLFGKPSPQPAGYSAAAVARVPAYISDRSLAPQ